MASRTAPWFKPAPAPSNWAVRVASTGYAPGTTWGSNPMGGYSFNPPNLAPPQQPVAAPSQWQPQPVGGNIRAGLASIQGKPMPVQTGLTNLPPGVTGTFGGQATIGQPPGPPVGDIPGQVAPDQPPPMPIEQQEEEGEIIAQKRDENGNLWVAFKTGEGKIMWRLAPRTPTAKEPSKSDYEVMMNTRYQYPWQVPGSQEGLTWDEKGNAYRGWYTAEGQFIGRSEPLGVTVPGKGPQKAPEAKTWSSIWNPPGTQRQFIATFREGQDQPLTIGREITPEPPKPANWSIMPGSEKTFFKGPEAGAPGAPALPGRLVTGYEIQDEAGNKQWKTVKEEPFATTQWNSPQDLERLKLEREHEAEDKELKEKFGSGVRTAAQNMYNIQQPQNWIQKQIALGQTPATPPELANILGQQAGKALQRKSLPFLSVNQWEAMTPQIKTQIMGYLQWIGIDPNQWIQDMQNLWQSGRPTPGVRWGVARQR